MSVTALSARAEAITRRTYNRPLDDAGERFETWGQTVERSTVEHHRRLWADAGGDPDEAELASLRELGLDRSALVSGRTLWLGGTDYAYSRAGSQFNCAGTMLETVYDVVDAFWLLLNGSGVGGKPQVGTLHGYSRPIHELTVVPSTRGRDDRGIEANVEQRPAAENGYTWAIVVGDSAPAWAKALGKLLVGGRGRVDRLVLDFSQIRGPGGRLRGYGWICNGYRPLADAFAAIHAILNRQAGNLLDEIDIADVFNWCGTVLSSRRAAEALLMDDSNPRLAEYAVRKDRYWEGNNQRRQSNDSILFWRKPTRSQLADLLAENHRRGDPGFVNAEAALRRCPWFKYFNPCFEVCLGSFCNLSSYSLPHFGRDFAAIERAVWLLARANYRQTCVDLRDEVLQPRWNQTNEALRLCGVSPTGIVQADWLTDHQIVRLRNSAVAGAYSMADELGTPRPKAVTVGKPEGTRAKIAGRVGMEIAEGIHRPPGRFVFNWVNFSSHDPLVEAMAAGGYKVLPNPSDPANVLVRFPVEFSGCRFDRVGGKAVNLEPAVAQLARYRRWNTLWADMNMSATISFDEAEIPAIVDWLDRHWDDGYVATAFLARVDPVKTAADLGHPYLPQEVVTEDVFREAAAATRAVDWDRFHRGRFEIADANDCAGGACPIK